MAIDINGQVPFKLCLHLSNRFAVCNAGATSALPTRILVCFVSLLLAQDVIAIAGGYGVSLSVYNGPVGNKPA